MNTLTAIAKPLPNEDIMVVGTYVTLENRYVYLRRIDKYGNTLWTKKLDDETSGDLGAIVWGEQAVLTEDIL